MTDRLPPDEPDGYWTRTSSPDGAFIWFVNAYDVRMSHWIMSGSLWRRDPSRRLFEAPSGWSFERRSWLSNDLLKLEGRCYPGRLPGIGLTLDASAERGLIEVDDLAAQQQRGGYLSVTAGEVPVAPAEPRSFDDVARWLEAFPRE